MSARDDAHGGRFEPMVSTAARGEGLALVGRCDECMKPSPVRSQTKVLKGPLRGLRGLRGMVCKTCKDARQAVPA